MDQLVRDVWNWLPTFRAIAQTEHLPSAAEQLYVSTSAVSRTLKLLEDHIGHELFNRVGRSLVLNTMGERLLRAVQDAMRDVELGLEEVMGDPFEGRVSVSAIGVLSNQIIVPALLRLKQQHPGLRPVLENLRTIEANDLLVRGQIDVAFYYETVEHPALRLEHLGETTSSIYCGQGHPLFEKAGEVGLEEVLEHPFSVPMIGDSGQPMDGWPIDVDRDVGMQITLLRSNLAVCLSGQMITVLPDVTAFPYWKEGRLRRLPSPELSPIHVWAGRRREGHQRSSAAALVEAVRDTVEEVNKALEPLRCEG
jgi:DNA-binding transcriptional LysR family regulator